MRLERETECLPPPPARV